MSDGERIGGFLPPTPGTPSGGPIGRPAPPAPREPSTGPSRAPGGTAANVALMFGVLGLVIFPPIFSTLAIILGRRARARLEASGAQRGLGTATAAVVLGWLGLAFLALLLALLAGGVISVDGGQLSLQRG